MARSKPRSPGEWRAILEGMKSCGLTQKQYAEQVGCHPSNFGWWRKRLKELDERQSEGVTTGFVELRAPEKVHSERHLEAPGQVQIKGKHGTVIEFASLPPAEYIARILREA